MHDDTTTHATASTEPTTEWITTAQLARWLQLSDRYLRELRERKAGAPYSRIGRSVRYRVADVRAWLASTRVGA